MVRKLEELFFTRRSTSERNQLLWNIFTSHISVNYPYSLYFSVHPNFISIKNYYMFTFLYVAVDNTVCVGIPRGFKWSGKVLQFKLCLYSLKQFPRDFFLRLKRKLEEHMLCLVYVKDSLFFTPNISKFDNIL